MSFAGNLLGTLNIIPKIIILQFCREGRKDQCGGKQGRGRAGTDWQKERCPSGRVGGTLRRWMEEGQLEMPRAAARRVSWTEQVLSWNEQRKVLCSVLPLTWATDFAGILGSRGLAIVAPVLAVDLEDAVVPAWTIVIVRFRVIITLVFHQAHPCRRKRDPRGEHEDMLSVNKRKDMTVFRMHEVLEK